MKTLNKLVAATILGLSTACAPIFRTGNVNFHPLNEGCVEGLPVKVSYNGDESWKIIRIESPDGHYVEAVDEPISPKNYLWFFDKVTHSSNIELNHPLRKYLSSEVLEDLYNQVKSGRNKKCS